MAPPRCVFVSGIVTGADGAALNSTATVAVAPPSAAVYEEAPNVTVVWPVVALATLDGTPVPLALMADTR